VTRNWLAVCTRRAHKHMCVELQGQSCAGADGVWRIERVFEHSQIAL